MENLSNVLLIEAYVMSVQLNLDQEFIRLIEEEMKKRVFDNEEVSGLMKQLSA